MCLHLYVQTAYIPELRATLLTGTKGCQEPVHAPNAVRVCAPPSHCVLRCRSRAGVRLDVDATRAEEQECEEGGLADTLKNIVRRTMPCPRFVRYHEAHVQRYLSRLKAFPPRCAPCSTHPEPQVLSNPRFTQPPRGLPAAVRARQRALPDAP